ncbi:MAG: NAD(+)/NADH kinase [Bacillota bacterium]
MKVGIYSNLTRDIDGLATKALVDFLVPEGHLVYISDELSELSLAQKYYNRTELAKVSDIVIVFGGDGTILGIAKECALYDAKIFAVNLGHMGYLAEVENIKLNKIIDDISHNKYFVEERNMLEVEIKGSTYTALNEVVFGRNSTKLLKCEVKVAGTILHKYNSDGIIICTPTGSTAYSLSAGGPIVSPDVGAIIITPICAHSLNSRPVVVGDNNKIEVKLIQREGQAHVSIDGKTVEDITREDSVLIHKSPLTVKFLRLKKYNYYEKLLGKMSLWSSFDSEEQ